ncbi:MAG: tRNA(Ile)-lysidine synthase [Candidatus Omnitrophica bacterium]|nr:tRNA(Ile)-lysidine synthase [Candidatus Omnitrophota bacterium]
MNPTRALLRSITALNERHGLFEPGGSVLVAYSGGPDSTALLEALCLLSRRHRLRIEAAHLDHGWHGGSGRWADACVRRAASLGVRLHLGRLSRSRPVGSKMTEADARQARYAFLVRTARKRRIGIIATGHTADDQAETFLLRLFRGAGPLGLAGIPAVRAAGAGIRVIRPLLWTDRSAVMSFLRERGVPHLSDPSNKDHDRLRNRVRHIVLPFLEEQFGTSVKSRLNEASAACSDAALELVEAAERARNKVLSRRGGRVIVKLDAYLACGRAVRMELLMSAWKDLGGEHRGLTRHHLEGLDRLSSGTGPAATLQLPGAVARRSGGRLELLRTRRLSRTP